MTRDPADLTLFIAQVPLPREFPVHDPIDATAHRLIEDSRLRAARWGYALSDAVLEVMESGPTGKLLEFRATAHYVDL